MAIRATVKLADLAREAGLSKCTASNLFSRPEVVRDEVREHVRQTANAMGDGGPSVQGRLLRAG